MSKKNNDNSFYSNNKFLIWILIFVIIFVLVMTYITKNKEEVKPKEEVVVINITPDKDVSVGVGNTINLEAKINVLNAKIYWVSSDSSIATVENGNVTGVNVGKATITAMYIDQKGEKNSATCLVSVVKNSSDIEIDKVAFPEGDVYMPVGSKYSLKLNVVPAKAEIDKKVFKSSNESVVKVDEDGVITALKEGSARVYVTVNDIHNATALVYVNNVYQNAELLVSPESLLFNIDSRKLKVGESEKIEFTVVPNNASRNYITWSSSDENIVTVNNSGVIAAKNEGVAIITASTPNGIKDRMVIEVTNNIVPVQDIIVQSNDINMKSGTTQTITPTVSPSNASNQGLNYFSLDPSIVSVSVNGIGQSATLSALKKGNTTIIVKSGNIEKRINVSVTGDGNNSQIDEDDAGLPTTIVVRSDKNNLAKSYDLVKDIPVPGVSNVKVTLAIGVGKIKYCYNKYGESLCKPSTEQYADTTIIIPSGDIYVLRIIKYDYKDKEIPSSSANYIDGVLNYYINTKSDNAFYTVDGAYNMETSARLTPAKVGNKVNISVTDNTKYLNVCYSLSACTPNTKVYSNASITISSVGLTKIYINTYDKNTNNKIGNTEVYYVFVGNENSYIEVDTKTNRVKADSLGVYTGGSIGRYISVNVNSNLKFDNVRFCYKVVNKGVNDSCKLDVSSSSVTKHDGSTYLHPTTDSKTYYGTFTETNNKRLMFDIDTLDTFFTNNDTSKDIILEFSIKSSKGYSTPIKVRVNMTSKVSNTGYWKLEFIK